MAVGQELPLRWSPVSGENVAWQVEIPGMGHSSPIVWGDRIYLTTAVAEGGNRPGLTTGDAGIDPAADVVEHRWMVLALDRDTGEVAWSTVAHQGVPRVKRHVKGSHASATPATDGRRIVALLASEGLFCLDMEGRVLWRADPGVLDVGYWGQPEYQWGPASSPVIWNGRVYVQNDRQEGSFLAAYDLETGAELWRSDRNEKPAWSTPAVYEGARPELITNGANWLRGTDPATGIELWRSSHGDLEVITPSPIVAGDRVIITGGNPTGARPIYAIRPGGSGDITPPDGAAHGEHLLWRQDRGSPYTPTPLAYEGLLYVIVDNGVLSVYDLDTGERRYRVRVASGAGFSASPVAADGRVYLASEDGDVFVIAAGAEYEVLAHNEMGEPLMATPALAGGSLVIRGRDHVFAITAAGPAGEGSPP